MFDDLTEMLTASKIIWKQVGPALLINSDCLEVLPMLEEGSVDAVVTDPPYGISYRSGMTGCNGGTSLPGIIGDDDTSLRDAVMDWNNGRAAIVFGSWKVSRPVLCRAVLTWNKGDHVGMGDLSLPWKPNTEEVYVIGDGFSGHRGSAVLNFNAPVSWNSVAFGRLHPHEKPVELMEELVDKCPTGTILDPFMGSGTTGVACIRTERKFIGIEIEPKYFDISVNRCRRAWQEKRSELPFEKPPEEKQRSLEFAEQEPE